LLALAGSVVGADPAVDGDLSQLGMDPQLGLPAARGSGWLIWRLSRRCAEFPRRVARRTPKWTGVDSAHRACRPR
jgi:hypothetical protein